MLREEDPRWLSPEGKNPGDVWHIATTPFPEPISPYTLRNCVNVLSLRVVLPKSAGNAARRNCCKKRRRKAFNIRVRDVQKGKLKAANRRASDDEIAAYDESNYEATSKARRILGCDCNEGFEAGVVFDPFMGSGTTAVVAQRLGRHF
ncbi:MAG: hypothetical protein HS102_08040 [Planctomycetia bacterium]|nr:hypothetical protein [Planctomycetia bacterium]